MSYLMENSSEADRLIMKSDSESTQFQLQLTGLKPGAIAVDAGAGAGFVAKIMREIVGETGAVTLLDQSNERLQFAKNYIGNLKNVDFVACDLEKIDLESNFADYSFSRFVFEYLKNPGRVLNEMIRITKPGGRVIVGDLDSNLLNHHPTPDRIQSALLEVSQKLVELGVWDPFAGRKIYHWMYKAGLKSIRVHCLAHHLLYGAMKESDYQNWIMKLDQIEGLSKKGVLTLSFDPAELRVELLEWLRREDRFSYTPLILCDAIKPEGWSNREV